MNSAGYQHVKDDCYIIGDTTLFYVCQPALFQPRTQGEFQRAYSCLQDFKRRYPKGKKVADHAREVLNTIAAYAPGKLSDTDLMVRSMIRLIEAVKPHSEFAPSSVKNALNEAETALKGARDADRLSQGKKGPIQPERNEHAAA